MALLQDIALETCKEVLRTSSIGRVLVDLLKEREEWSGDDMHKFQKLCLVVQETGRNLYIEDDLKSLLDERRDKLSPSLCYNLLDIIKQEWSAFRNT